MGLTGVKIVDTLLDPKMHYSLRLLLSVPWALAQDWLLCLLLHHLDTLFG